MYFNFSIFVVESSDSFKQVEPKRAFNFNDTHFGIVYSSGGTSPQKYVLNVVCNDKSVCKSIVSSLFCLVPQSHNYKLN